MANFVMIGTFADLSFSKSEFFFFFFFAPTFFCILGNIFSSDHLLIISPHLGSM